MIATWHTNFGLIDEVVSSKFYSGVKVFEDKRCFTMLDERVEAHL